VTGVSEVSENISRKQKGIAFPPDAPDADIDTNATRLFYCHHLRLWKLVSR